MRRKPRTPNTNSQFDEANPNPTSQPNPSPASPRLPRSFSPEFVLEELHRIAGQDDVTQATKIRALELGMKYYGMLEDRLTITAESLSPSQRAQRVQLLLDRAQSRLSHSADNSVASEASDNLVDATLVAPTKL